MAHRTTSDFINNLFAPALVFSKELIVLSGNKSFGDLLGIKLELVEGSSLSQLFNIPIPHKELQKQLSVLSASPSATFTLKVAINAAQFSGSFTDISILVQNFKAHQLFLGMVMVKAKPKNRPGPDISDEQLFRLLLNELPDAIYFKDLKGRFFLTNRLHVKKLGFSDEADFVGLTDFDLFSEEHARQAFNDEQQVIRTGKTISKEEKETYFDGSETWASTTKMPLRNVAGEIVGTFGISKDISMVKNTEFRLRKAEKKLQEANAAKDKFFSILAHDLKNPFNSLIGMSEVLVEDFVDLSENEKLEMVLKIQRTSESAYALLENLLDWSRMQQGAIPLIKKTLDLKSLTEEAIEVNQLHAYNKKIEITNKVLKGETIIADENMIRTVLRNLLSNSIKFTHQGGKVTVFSERDKKGLHIIVEDNGIGMDAETQSNLFKISEKVKTYGTNDETGTGLGLIICRDFVEKNNGVISVESKVGAGSKFRISFPAM